MNRQTKQWLAVTVVVLVGMAILVALMWHIPSPQQTQQTHQQPDPGPDTRSVATRPGSTGEDAPTTAASTGGRQQALRDLNAGRAAYGAGDLLQARVMISRAIFSGHLTTDEEANAIADASRIADGTILGPTMIEADPYVTPYRVRSGDTIEGANGIERSRKLHVPARLILRVNRLARGEDIRPGQVLKLVKGPFHAIVHKNDFTMDIYLQRDEGDKIFIRRMPVGLGRNSTTPVGSWRVQKGQKLERPPWDPPPGSGLRQRILWGEPDYAFGVKGLWIGLEGTDERTGLYTDIGIHSTNDPNSIGKANSLGCIRLADDDIDLVYSLLYDQWSCVYVVP
jgi:lipoprotein-anchoring transpeptidase ErfK/SrfK